MSRSRGSLALCVLVAVVIGATGFLLRGAGNPAPDEIAAVLAQPDATLAPAELEALRAFYARRNNAPAWPVRDAELLRDAIGRAGEDGLDSNDYPIETGEGAKQDVRLTVAALRFARDLREGRPRLKALDRDVDLPLGTFDAPGELSRALHDGTLADFLSSLPPPDPAYQHLKQALASYRAIAAKGGWASLPPLPAAVYASDARAADLLRARLAYEDGAANDAGALTDAVKRFQARHGLDSDGRVGPRTRAALDAPAAERALQIVANMERWRWLPRAFEATYVVINVPDARLRVIQDGRVVLESRVIVGRVRAPTPILRALATSVTVNPPWNVPDTIARKEILPKIRRDPTYLASERMVFVDGHLRQLPGEKNALGQLKLELPNRFDVYLHDTPAQAAFALSERYLSHGCVRVEDIKGLASFALAGDTASMVPELEAAIAAGETEHLPVAKALPIYFLYWTAFADEDGTMEFRDDTYGRDERLIAALEKNAARGQAAALPTSVCEPVG